MSKSNLHILIVEDDDTQGRALREALVRTGYSATHCKSGPLALELSRNQEFHAVIADCMLPKMNGVDLLVEIRDQSPLPPHTFLISGIFRDKAFIKASLDKTGALAFWTKPLDLNELVERVDEVFAGRIQGAVDAGFASLYRENEMTANELLELMERTPSFPAPHVPMLYKRLQSTELSGELAIVFSGGATFTVGIIKGKIGWVRTPDTDTYFGALAVGLGFVEPEDVLEVLKEPSKKMLGQRLIDSMLLSPHAIDVILEEQLALRLSQTVGQGLVNVRWTEKTLPAPSHVLQSHRFQILLGDWTRSKMDAEALRPLFSSWGTLRLQGHYHQDILDAATVDELFSNPEWIEATDLPYLHRQLLEGNATLGERGEALKSFAFLEHRLSQLLESHKQQNYYQVLGVSENVHHQELNRVMGDLRSHFDPANLPADAPPALRTKAADVFSHIELAYRTLHNETSRTEYASLMTAKRNQEFFELEPVLKKAVQDLMQEQAEPALEALETIMLRKIEFKDVRAYYLWAGLKAQKKYFKGITLEQIPPEERHSAPYHMAKGVWHRQRGQVSKAIECFRTANALDPRLNAARAEVTNLREEIETRGSPQLLRDATSVMDGLLRKRG